MAILIKGMKMPENCGGCIFKFFGSWSINEIGYICKANPNIHVYTTGMKRPSDCPLIEVPPHVDLIDRSAAIESIEWKWAGKAAFDALKAVPIIIESEGEA